MQVQKKLLNKAIGRGGVKCKCCNPKFKKRSRSKKLMRQVYTQLARTQLKRIEFE